MLDSQVSKHLGGMMSGNDALRLSIQIWSDKRLPRQDAVGTEQLD